MNWYAYVGNDPLNGSDSTGLCDGRAGFCAEGDGGDCSSVWGCPGAANWFGTAAENFNYGEQGTPFFDGHAPGYQQGVNYANSVSSFSSSSGGAWSGDFTGDGATLQFAAFKAPPFTLGPQFSKMGINGVRISESFSYGNGGLDHIEDRHGSRWSDSTAGRFALPFRNNYTALVNAILVPVLESPTSVISPNTLGRPGVLVIGMLPYVVGSTGAFNGMQSIMTNRVQIVLRPSPGFISIGLGFYDLWTAYPF